MTVGDTNFGSCGRIGLLAGIAACGSITVTAKAFGMSYKAAWDAVDIMSGTLTAIVIRESCENLAIAVGQPVAAIFKASSAIVCVPTQAGRRVATRLSVEKQ